MKSNVEQAELLETFTFSKFHGSQEHTYRITAHEHKYALEKDGIFVAELERYEFRWRQVAGKKLTDVLIHEIGDRIEDHYC